MFQQGVKLANMPWNDTYTVEQVKAVTSRMSLCFLSCLNCLRLLERDDAYIKSPKALTVYRGKIQQSDTIIKVDDVKKMYHLTMAKLELLPNITHFARSFRIVDPIDVFGVYCQNYDTQNALAFANLFSYDLEKIVLSSVDVIICLSKNQNWYNNTNTVSFLTRKNLRIFAQRP
jgi:transposase-like protein